MKKVILTAVIALSILSFGSLASANPYQGPPPGGYYGCCGGW